LSAATDAAAGLTPELAGELVEKIPVTRDDALATELADATGQSVEAEETPSSTEAAAAQKVEQEAAVEIPSYEADVPDDLLAELDEPDFEAEAEAETSGGEEEYVEGFEADSEERKRRIAAEKKAVWLEQRLAEQNKGKWQAEAKKYFPLSEHALANIKADSRRAFLREARAAHEAILPYVKPLVERLAEVTQSAKEQARAEGRGEAAAAWGAPTTGPGVVPVKASANEAELEAARKTGNLAKIIGVLMKQGG
jgi:hypothetical protein